ncbi:MAG: hypothetical protein KA791_07185 [Flavobacteriales bacterium]|nr:hypothetical protein [Flavobacteriales bacterium]
MRSSLTVLICAFGVVCASAQSVYDDEGRTLYSKEIYGGPIAHGDGWGGQIWFGKYRTAADRHLFGFEIVGMKHPKEIKSYNPYYEDSRGYFYGKLNSLLILRPGYGRKHRITEKIRKSGVELNYIWAFGPSLALLKPVYLQIGYRVDAQKGPPYDNIVEELYDPQRHNASNIYGRASWFRGLNELRVRPGAFGRLALNFEYAGDNTGIRALEVGTTVDAYPEVIPIMAEMDDVVNKRIFLEFYLALQFGSKTIR